jgi:signal transduction histidine kinase
MALMHERARLARDLHDHVGAGLTGIALRAERETQRAKGGELDGWSWAQETSRMCLEELRDAIWALSDERRDLGELLSVLRRRAEDACGSAEIGLRWEVEGDPAQVDLRAELATALSSVLREAVANAIRHSGTKEITVHLLVSKLALSFTVTDHGKGLAPGSEAGRGMTNIRSRVRELGGATTIDNGPSDGVVVSVQLPAREPEVARS